jgi:hypothetical protein
MHDPTHARELGIKPQKKYSTKHPYTAIEHRVIDSAAYADLTFSARSLLVLIARQLSKDNNGWLQATYSYMKRYRFGENTLSRAIAELIAHGMIYRTRSGGYQQGAAQYAVTWLSICKMREGLFLQGFKPYAWRDWQPDGKNIPPSKRRLTHLQNGEWIASATPKKEAVSPPKSKDIELMPCNTLCSSVNEESSRSDQKEILQ